MAKSERPRRRLVIGLIVLAFVIGLLAVFSIWVKRQALETDNWVDTSAKLLEDEEISDQLALYLVDQLYANIDVQAEVAAALPPRLQPLAGPIAGGIRQAADRGAKNLLDRPKAEQLWEDANRNAHERFVTVIDGDAPDDDITISLATVVQALGDQIGVDVADRLPPDTAELVVIPASDLSNVQDAVKLFKDLVIVLAVLALGLFALAVYLARGWRREALRDVGFAFIAIGIAVLALRSLGGGVVAGSLATTTSVEPAAQNAWTIGTSLLSEGAGAMIFYGLAIIFGAWLAGPGRVASGLRRSLTPLFRDPSVAYPTLLVLLLVLFWWAPTEGFRRLPISILIIALLVGGFELLRRKAIRDFPDETWEKTSERWRKSGPFGRRASGD
ncbi:MAG: hypothetical protein M3M99_03515 [Actinomycetota bacterium]|nr:hypothetical protein [Actinomycetota bacterium]